LTRPAAGIASERSPFFPAERTTNSTSSIDRPGIVTVLV
jgi:hypothetical protein